uniref:Uncharacterized protein n=1 Tax=Caenorhabditis japonica TaxID=281687 RepID=A0A8R1EJZ2_CAEJA
MTTTSPTTTRTVREILLRAAVVAADIVKTFPPPLHKHNNNIRYARRTDGRTKERTDGWMNIQSGQSGGEEYVGMTTVTLIYSLSPRLPVHICVFEWIGIVPEANSQHTLGDDGRTDGRMFHFPRQRYL